MAQLIGEWSDEEIIRSRLAGSEMELPQQDGRQVPPKRSSRPGGPDGSSGEGVPSEAEELAGDVGGAGRSTGLVGGTPSGPRVGGSGGNQFDTTTKAAVVPNPKRSRSSAPKSFADSG